VLKLPYFPAIIGAGIIVESHRSTRKEGTVKTASFSLIVLAMIAMSCAPRQTEDAKFESLADNYIEGLLKMSPEWATSLGDHRYDARVSDYSKKGIDETRAFTKAYLDSLGSINVAALSPVNAVDFKIMKSNLQSWVFQIDTLKEYEWNPLSYTVGNVIYPLIAREFAPLSDRMASVKGRLSMVPAILDAAKSNLTHPPAIFTETALRQNTGTIALVRDELTALLDSVPDLKAEFVPVQDRAVKALEEYGVWLEKELMPRSNGDFRIGDEKFRRKLAYSLESGLTKEEILDHANMDLKKTQEALYATALPLFSQYFPHVTEKAKREDRKAVIKAVLAKLADSHPTNETIVDQAKKDLSAITAFVRDRGLVSLPTEPVRIIVMPEYQRGVAVAYCDAPGALEKKGETFFSISPTPKDWTKERAESFFREYNDYMLQNLTVHEAMPGHYLQLDHANKFKAPTMIRAIFGSGTFVEGWATYAEQLMVEQGYGGPELKMQQLKMRLRLIINSIIDQKIHTAGMTEKEALDLMMNEGFQEEGEAAGKWRRACLSSTQLSTYYVGNTEINGIRQAYEAKHTGSVDLKVMHDAMLSFGSPAPKYVKEMMGL
jgi:uncharacterized protein (DUF885 family)